MPRRTQLQQITHLICFFLFRDFNDGKYPRSQILWKKHAPTFWDPFSLIGLFFCGEMFGIPKWVAFSRGFFWWFSGATAQRYQSHWKQAERAIELERFHIHCDVCPRRKNTTSSCVSLILWLFLTFFAAFNRLGTSKTIVRSSEPMLLKRRGVFKPNFVGTYGTFQKDWIMAKGPKGVIKAGPKVGLRFWIHSICAPDGKAVPFLQKPLDMAKAEITPGCFRRLEVMRSPKMTTHLTCATREVIHIFECWARYCRCGRWL